MGVNTDISSSTLPDVIRKVVDILKGLECYRSLELELAQASHRAPDCMPDVRNSSGSASPVNLYPLVRNAPNQENGELEIESNRYYTIKQVSAKLCVSEQTVRRWIKKPHHLTAHKIGGQWRISGTALTYFIYNNSCEGRNEIDPEQEAEKLLAQRRERLAG